MIVRELSSIEGSERDVRQANWRSRRLLLASDGMGFSLHDTVLYAGTATKMQYLHHLEAVYVVEGHGELEDLDSGERHPLAAGSLYALDRHDRHVVHAVSDVRCVCVFNPAVTGHEVHDEHGAYPAATSSAAQEATQGGIS